ncbi:MAG: hypothetical protein ACHRXM_29035 [Isosphaerales bacterium]
MIRILRLPGRLLVVMALAVAATGPLARAQDFFEKHEIDEAALPLLHFGVSNQQFDQRVFGSGGAAQFRRRVELSLTARVSDVDRICQLTAVQKKKLLLAGRGDIKRFFDHVEESRQKIEHESIDLDELRAILQEFQRRLARSRFDLFGEKSLFQKSLKNTLTAEQFATFQKITRDVVAAHHRTTITWVAGIMDTTLRLSKEQHRRFEELLVNETRPPMRFGEYDYYGLMFQLSRLPDARLRPIFDGDQWSKLSLGLAEAVRLEQTLKEGGFVPDDQVAEAATGRRERPLARPVQPRG